MQRRHGVSVAFAVALWERYNRLILAHSQGMPALVTRYSDLVDDPAAWSHGARAFLSGQGMALAPAPDDVHDRIEGFVDAELRHSTHTRSDVAGAAPSALDVFDALEAAMGPSDSFLPPDLAPEPAVVQAELETVGPRTQLAWHPPDGEAPSGTEGRA
jgi:hypothetical protein